MNRKRLTAIALASCLAICLAVPAFAAEEESANYDYTVKVSAGASGTASGETETTVGYGEAYDPADNVTVTPDAGYYLKGYHIAGQDTVKNGDWTITEDTTLVASYGISGEQDLLAYTIHYQAEDGTTLADDRTYYGLEGDKPVVAYQVIDGYLPRDTYNVTWTLSADRTNEYTFVYVPATTVTTVTTTTTNTVTTPAATGTTAAGTTATGTAAGGAAAGGAAAGGAAAGGAAGEAGAAGPADIVDLDEGEVPLAGVDDTNGDNGDGTGVAGDEEVINDDQVPTAGMSTAAKAGIGVIIAAAIVAIIAALAVRARKKNKEEEV
ncbi:MAG: hypothetical protein E7236_00040 [Lachnospiraceae bacterium]|nr:hypothetical protein [Lachnospiraceae bacterium]